MGKFPFIMTLNRKYFFVTVRTTLFKTGLKQTQVNGLNAILDRWEASELTDFRWLAYMLATTFHETAKTMQPIEEYGKGKNYKYGKKVKRSGIPYTLPDKIYYGRGYVQLTWYENYETMGRLLGIDLLNNPELALDAHHAADIMFEGMTKGNSNFGDFTGKSLEHYFNDTKEDWVNARKIINGLDKAELIAGYGKKFYNALKLI
jgi:putative chitinase